eukprot:1187649-Prorocentrum_minimum.AAC.2
MTDYDCPGADDGWPGAGGRAGGGAARGAHAPPLARQVHGALPQSARPSQLPPLPRGVGGGAHPPRRGAVRHPARDAGAAGGGHL